MRAAFRLLPLATAILFAVAAQPHAAKDRSKDQGKDKKAAAGASGDDKASAPPGAEVNACGCYHNAQGACVCTSRKAKCVCPGECEPVGCEEKRQKEMEREMEAEIKRAQEEDKKRQAAEAAAESGGGDNPDGAAAPDAGDEGTGAAQADKSAGKASKGGKNSRRPDKK
jgi:hypothetical protein